MGKKRSGFADEGGEKKAPPLPPTTLEKKKARHKPEVIFFDLDLYTNP